jgi:hypothetical protein
MRRGRNWLSTLIVAGVVAAGTAAAAEPTHFEISGFGAYRFGGEFETETTGSGVDLEDGGGWGLGLALYRDPVSFYEFLYSTQQASLDRSDPVVGGLDVTTEYFQVGGTLLFPQEQGVVPYFSLTLGLTRLKASGYGSETEFSGSLGGGLRVPINDRLSFALGLRGYLTLVDSDTGFFCSSVNGQGTCLVRVSGSTFFQGEATAGLALRF